MVGTLANQHNQAGTTLMDGFASPQYRYGVIHRKADGSLRVFRQDTTVPPNGAVAECSVAVGGEAYIYYDIAIGSAMGNALDLPIKGGGHDGPGGGVAYDAHYYVPIGVDSQDRLWLPGNMHHTDFQQCIRSAPANGAWDATWRAAWVDVADFTASSAEVGLGAFTYNYFTRTSDGTLIWMFDQADNPTSSRGRDFLCFFMPPGAGTTWQKALGTGALDSEVFQCQRVGTSMGPADITDPPKGWFPSDTRVADRSYLVAMDVFYDSAGVEWFACVGIWRTGDKYGNTAQQPFYVKIRVVDLVAQDDTAWKTVDGYPQPMPVTWQNRNTAGGTISPARPAWDLPAPHGPWVARARGATISSAGFVHRTTGGFCHDENGYPHVILGNGGVYRGPLDPAEPDNGTAGERMGEHPIYRGVNIPILRHYWDGDDWQVETTTPASRGNSQPQLDNHRGEIVMVTCNTQRITVSTNAGVSGPDLGRAYIGGIIHNGLGVPHWRTTIDKDKPIAFSIPDYDTPRVYTYGGHAQFNGGPGTPGTPVVVAGDAQAIVTWTAPSRDGGSPILGYRVIPAIAGVDQAPIDFPGTTTIQTVTGLVNGTTYTFKVEAYNMWGTGLRSAASNAVTPA